MTMPFESAHWFSISALAAKVSWQIEVSVISFSGNARGYCSLLQKSSHSGSSKNVEIAWNTKNTKTIAIAVDKIPFFQSTIPIL